ncbi:hypothetical protein [Halomonas sp.]|uniref:hypothetical protein n=1 Tax=Halomonas sp. TaxID=1486246 RepID=UPI0038509149
MPRHPLEPLSLDQGDSIYFDSIYFDSDMGHTLISMRQEDAVVLSVCTRVEAA